MNYFAAGSISCRTGYMQSDKPDKDQLLREALPFVRQTLQEEFTVIPVEDQPTLLKTTLRVYEHTLRIAQKKSMNLPAFARRVLREQAHVWQLRQGSTTSEQWVWNTNQAGLRAYLHKFSFRTDEVIDDVIAQTFQSFFQNMRQEKPLSTLLRLYLIKIAYFKALNELRKEGKAGKEEQRFTVQSLEQTFVEVDDDDLGSLQMPIPLAGEEEYSRFVEIEGNSVSVTTATLHQFLQECLEQLSQQRREAIRLRYRVLSEADLASMSPDEVTAFVREKMKSTEIAKALGFANAQVVNTRVNESIGRLQQCIQGKILNITR